MMTLADKLLISTLLVCALAGLFILPGLGSRGRFAVVETGGGDVLRLDLAEDGQWSVGGPLGPTLIEVRGGCVRVIDSPCPHKLCIQMGCRRGEGDIIACIPNRVIIRVEGGGGERTLDGVTR